MKDKEAEGQRKETKQTWQLNATHDTGLDPGSKEKNVCWQTMNMYHIVCKLKSFSNVKIPECDYCTVLIWECPLF